MRRIVYALLAALCLTGIAAAADWYGFDDSFSLWTYTLGTVIGMTLALIGLLLSIGKLMFSRRKGAGLTTGALIILTGVFTFLLSLLVWVALGKPAA